MKNRWLTIVSIGVIGFNTAIIFFQGNTFMGGVSNYNFSLRKLVVEPK